MKSGSRLEQLLEKGEFVATAELGPPKSSNREVIERKAQLLKDCVDAVNITDNQTAIVRLSSIAAAQIAMGVDFIYAERFGVFEAAREAGIFAFGNKKDEHDAAPDVVLSSAISLWDAAIAHAIDVWQRHETEGGAYALPAETYVASMAEGGSALAPYHGLADKVPQDVKDAVETAKKGIMDGSLKVPFNRDKAVSTP